MPQTQMVCHSSQCFVCTDRVDILVDTMAASAAKKALKNKICGTTDEGVSCRGQVNWSSASSEYGASDL